MGSCTMSGRPVTGSVMSRDCVAPEELGRRNWTAGMTVVDGEVKMGWGAGTANGNVCGRTMICRVPLILRFMLVRVGRGMGAAGSTRTSTAVSHNLKDEEEADGDQLRPGLGKRWVWMQEG